MLKNRCVLRSMRETENGFVCCINVDGYMKTALDLKIILHNVISKKICQKMFSKMDFYHDSSHFSELYQLREYEQQIINSSPSTRYKIRNQSDFNRKSYSELIFCYVFYDLVSTFMIHCTIIHAFN